MKPNIAALFGLDTNRMTNEELADLISHLTEELSHRQSLIGQDLISQIQSATLSVRSWTKQDRVNMKDF